jgi:hypothetical protein
MFSVTLRAGEAVEIGDQAAVRVEKKSGSMVKLAFFTDLPLKMIYSGLIPPRYTHGITGEPKPVREPRVLEPVGGPAS